MLRSWIPSLSIAKKSKTPVYLQIARGFVALIESGRLHAGEVLPGSRGLARELGVHRNTVDAAYRELTLSGWARTEPSRGTFVDDVKPAESLRHLRGAQGTRKSMPKQPWFALREDAHTDKHIESQAHVNLSSGDPDPRLVPWKALASAYHRVLSRHSRVLLDHGDARGALPLRRALASYLSATRGLVLRPEEILITRGARMAVDLAARALVGCQDSVACEALGFPPLWQPFRSRGATLNAIAVDEEGLCVEQLAELCAQRPVRGVLVTPQHQHPTAVQLSLARRDALLRLAEKHRFVIFENDYEFNFSYACSRMLSLASIDELGAVVYMGSLSTLLAPGLRIGYLVAPQALIDHLARYRVGVDRQGDLALECAVAEMMDEGDLQRHVRKMARTYESRRQALVTELHSQLHDAVTFELPQGGTSLWLSVRGDIDVERWSERAAARGILFRPGRYYMLDGNPKNGFRIGFSRYNAPELQVAVAELRNSLIEI